MVRRIIRTVYLALAWFFVAGILTQAFFAGMGVLASRSNWNTHIELGHTLGLLPLLMLIMVFLGGYSRSTKLLTAGLLFNYLLMADFVIFIRRPPEIASLHPVLAMIMFAVALAIAGRARRELAWSPAATFDSNGKETHEAASAG